MAAPKGNEFWKIRSKHGRDKLFATPQLLWDAACEYFEWCDQNPFQKQDFIKGGEMAGTKVTMDVMRPYTLEGLCLYIDCNTAYFRNFKIQLKETDPQHQGFSAVITRIEETIRNQKFAGAASGFFNATIIARDLGLKDAKELDHTSGGKPVIPVIYMPENGRDKKE
jgi:hypothetical protein